MIIKPKVFISYSWTSEEYKEVVLQLADKLRRDGVDVTLDQWDLKPGNDRFVFMEHSIEQSDKVLVLCDKGYVDKAANRKGGVGTETTIITPEVYGNYKQEKFIPIIMDSFDTVPTYMKNAIGIDYRFENREKGYQEILRAVYECPVSVKPQLGQPPKWLGINARLTHGNQNTNLADKTMVLNVNNAEDLLGSIVDNTIINLDRGTYDISHTKASGKAVYFPAEKGRELVIRDVSDLAIIGNSSKIITEFSYATVITLHNCHNIELSDICIGHYPVKGCCTGSVLRLYECSNVTLNGVELFGCGEIGIMSSYTDGILLKNCHVFSCSDSALYIIGSRIKLVDSEISDCGESALSMIDLENSSLLFENVFIHNNRINGFIFNSEHSSVGFDSVIISNNGQKGVCAEEIVAPDTYTICDEKEGLKSFLNGIKKDASIRVCIEPNYKDDPNIDISKYTAEFVFSYDNDTLVRQLIKRCYQILPEPYDPIVHNPRYLVQFESSYYEIDEEYPLADFVNTFGVDGTLKLFYTIGLPGGYGLATIDGVDLFFHSNERGITPHIHAEYQGDEVSIDVLNLEVIGTMRSKKKLKTVVDFVSNHRSFIADQYRLHTNGIYVDPNRWEFYE